MYRMKAREIFDTVSTGIEVHRTFPIGKQTVISASYRRQIVDKKRIRCQSFIQPPRRATRRPLLEKGGVDKARIETAFQNIVE